MGKNFLCPGQIIRNQNLIKAIKQSKNLDQITCYIVHIFLLYCLHYYLLYCSYFLTFPPYNIYIIAYMSLVMHNLDDMPLVWNIKSGLVASEQKQVTFKSRCLLNLWVIIYNCMLDFTFEKIPCSGCSLKFIILYHQCIYINVPMLRLLRLSNMQLLLQVLDTHISVQNFHVHTVNH